MANGMENGTKTSVNESTNFTSRKIPDLAKNVKREESQEQKQKNLSARFKNFKFKKYTIREPEIGEKTKENKKNDKSDLKSKLRKVQNKELHRNGIKSAKKGFSFYQNSGLKITPNIQPKKLQNSRMKKSKGVRELPKFSQTSAANQRAISHNFIFSPVLNTQPKKSVHAYANESTNNSSIISSKIHFTSQKPSLERSQNFYNFNNQATWTQFSNTNRPVKKYVIRAKNQLNLLENVGKKEKQLPGKTRKIKHTQSEKKQQFEIMKKAETGETVAPGKLYPKQAAKENKTCHFVSQSASNLRELLQKYNKNQTKNQFQIKKPVPITQNDPKKNSNQMRPPSPKKNLNQKPPNPPKNIQSRLEFPKQANNNKNTLSRSTSTKNAGSKLLEKVKNIDGAKRNSREVVCKKESQIKDSLIKFIQSEQKNIESSSAHNRTRSNINFGSKRMNRFEHLPPVSYGSCKRPNKSILRKSKKKKWASN